MNLHNLGLVTALWAAGQVAAQMTTVVPNNIIIGQDSISKYVSGTSRLDGPKITPVINSTSYDWWYFDAVSNDASMGIVVVFYLSTDLGFPFVPPGSALSVDIFATFDDGSLVFLPLSNVPGDAGSATITTNGDGASGVWEGTGFSFDGTPDLSRYAVIIDNPTLGISGTLDLKSNAPAHYACGPNQPGVNLEVTPNVGWANAMPDADAVVNFTIGGRALQFNGVGYHDKNWGDKPFTTNVASWYWGHARFGPFSIVWFDVAGKDGNEYVSSYVARDGELITASCSGIKVRPTGHNNQYPPVITSGNPQGFHVDADLGSGKTISVDIETNIVLADAVLFSRWAGNVTGGITGGTIYTGVALYEEFKFDL